MLGGQGFYRGSSILISGTAGCGKTSLAAHFADAVCRRGESCLYFAFEESQNQLVRNMRSIGIDLQPWVEQGRLHFHAARPTFAGLEMHLTTMHKWIANINPRTVVIDPISNFTSAGTATDVKSMLIRLIDFLKSNQITSVFTHLTSGNGPNEQTDIGVSSIMDTWLLVRDMEFGGERNRCLYVLKSRGMAHSNQLREFLLTDKGVELADVYLGPDGMLTGSARLAQEARDRAAFDSWQQEVEAKQQELERERQIVESQIAVLRAGFQSKQDELTRKMAHFKSQQDQSTNNRLAMAHSRKADVTEGNEP
jgi:circadian clock protein KaiC